MQPRLLVCRLRSFRCHHYQANPYIREHFGPLVTIDHYPESTYGNMGFAASYRWPDLASYDACMNLANAIIEKHQITHAIIGQKLYGYSTIMEKACKNHGVKYIWAEAFFDNKMIYDSIGLQYCKDNEIYEFVNKAPLAQPQLPSTTREAQPKTLSGPEVFKKYNLNPNDRHIVIFGQLPWDMSLLQSVNKDYKGYLEFIKDVLDNNRGVKFLFKEHPKDNRHCRFGNRVIYINESIDTLFNTFEKFVAFSSTTIFEGVIRRKKFATMGFHLCNDDRLVFQMRTNAKLQNIYGSLDQFSIDEETRLRYLSFICNHYTIDFNSKRMLDKILLTPEEYYG